MIRIARKVGPLREKLYLEPVQVKSTGKDEPALGLLICGQLQESVNCVRQRGAGERHQPRNAPAFRESGAHYPGQASILEPVELVFHTPMVLAWLDGRKTETPAPRRVGNRLYLTT